MTPKNRSASISFTAYYTSEVWRQNGLSSDIFASKTGRTLYRLGQPIEAIAARVAGVSIGQTLLQRHLLIDEIVHRAIAGGVTQIVEIACGLSPRGLRFCAQYPQLHYVEADLPDMAAYKKHLLTQAQQLSERHRVVSIDILAEQGEQCLAEVFAAQLDPNRATLVITEGLINYFDLPTIQPFWQRLAQALAMYPKGAYVTDLYPNLTWHPVVKLTSAFKKGLAFATRSKVTLHFDDHAAIQRGFAACGFAQTTVHLPEDYYGVLPIPKSRMASLVRVVENWV